MVRFSLINAGSLLWPGSDFWQGHFQEAFDLFQAETFCHIKSDKISLGSKQLQKTQVQLATYAFWCGWRLLLTKYTGLPSWKNMVPRPFKLESGCREIFWGHNI